MVIELFRSGGEIERVNTDTVTAHQPRREGQEIPLRSRCGQHISGANAHPVKDQRNLVHQRDIEVALGVFDHFGGFSDLDVRRFMQANIYNRAVNCAHSSERFVAFGSDDLRDGLKPVDCVAGIDPLRAIAKREISPLLQT